MSFRPEALLAQIKAHFGARLPRYWSVALSSGLDSTVVLHALSRCLEQTGADYTLRALHVHHGLYADAEEWTEAARAQAQIVGCPFQVLRVCVQRAGGQSLEDCARRARYQALAGAMQPGEVMVTGHHQDDQLETVLLQLMRGAGVAGLAAMPVLADLGPGSHFRPLLGFTRLELQDWAAAQALGWIEEPSNLDTRFDRNYLRHEVLPRLKARWPTASRAATRSARYCAEARDLLSQIASQDLQACAKGDELEVPRLLAMDAARRANLLRHWAIRRGLPPPPAHVLDLVLEQVLKAGDHALPILAWKGGEFRRYRNRLFALPVIDRPELGVLRWSAEAPLVLPHALGVLSLVPAEGNGLNPSLLQAPDLEVRFRQGGERVRLSGRIGHHRLRDLFQESGVLPWARSQIPLLYAGGKLAAVGELWIDQGFAAPSGEKGLLMRWDGGPRLLL